MLKQVFALALSASCMLTACDDSSSTSANCADLDQPLTDSAEAARLPRTTFLSDGFIKGKTDTLRFGDTVLFEKPEFISQMPSTFYRWTVSAGMERLCDLVQDTVIDDPSGGRPPAYTQLRRMKFVVANLGDTTVTFQQISSSRPDDVRASYSYHIHVVASPAALAAMHAAECGR